MAKRAVNHIINATGAPKNYCEIYLLKNAFVLEVFQLRDKNRWNKGLSWQNNQ
ncbi:hypothetical protein [Hugenholtzia roseola]|uniref:hypothetical protein n=1 Tax=Hugenholtzia roseola TaxID=1002 RepID=UPI00041A1259|nr:hypothetical protein [Hugenholtzia roseola]